MLLRKVTLSRLIVCLPAIAGLLLDPIAADARGRGGFGGFGGGFGAAIGIIGAGVIANEVARNGGMPFPAPGYYYRARGGRSADTVSAIKPASVQNVDQSIDNLRRFSAYLRTIKQDRERNVDASIQWFLKVIADYTNAITNNNNKKAVKAGTTNEITKKDVLEAADAAYIASGLAKFEQFGADLWTGDRLRVEIIDRATMMLEPYYKGVAQTGLSKEDLNAVFTKSASQVFAIALESAELIGVEQSYDHLIRAIYENRPSTLDKDKEIDRAIDNAEQNFVRLWTASNPVGAPAGGSLNQPGVQIAAENETAYSLSKRYRAKRVLLDCVAEGYETNFKLRRVGSAKDVPAVLKDSGTPQGRPVASTPAAAPSGSKAAHGASEGLIWTQIVAYSDYVCTPMIKELVKNGGDSVNPAPVKVADWNDFYANQGTSLSVSYRQ
jgi:hypothetical protein